MSTLIGSNAPIPYVAPWAAQFNRFSTQIYNMAKVGATQYSITIPDGQWWRVVFAQVSWSTSATAATRQAWFEFQTPAGQTVIVPAPGTQTASLLGRYLFGATLSAYSVTIATSTTTQAAPWPDVMWAPGTQLVSLLNNGQANDIATNAPFIAVEIYTEHTAATTDNTPIMLTPLLS